MKVGLAGFAGSGKSTVFQWLTGQRPDPGKIQTGQVGHAEVPDSRLDRLSAMFRPRKTTPASIDFLDTPGLLPTERRDNPRRLGILRESSGLVVVLDAFTDADPAGQLRRFRDELVFADLEVVTNRIVRLDEQLKKPKPAKQKEADQDEHGLLVRIRAALEEGHPPAALGLRDDEEKAIRSFQLLTLKPEQVLLNVGDDRLNRTLPADLLEMAPGALQAPARLELELAELGEEDRQAFMQDLGVKGLVRDDVLRAIFAGMGQVAFFTVGEDECRAWPVPKGADAVTGASQVHTDLARGFVRAEVVAYDDFVRAGSMKEAKSQGVYRLEGKSYVVQDGDIMHILAST
jgi:ribosome-binding ATPase YchF (GTP1/OBG family)